MQKDLVHSKLDFLQNCAALLGCLYVILHMDTFATWSISQRVVALIGFVVVLLGTLFLANEKSLSFSKRKGIAVGVVLAFVFYFGVKNYFLLSIPLYFSLLLFTFWNDEIIEKSYKYFKYFILFYAVGNVIIFIMINTGLLSHVPYRVISAIDNVQQNTGTINRIYGVFVVTEGAEGLSQRCGGPLSEGGHFALFLGLVYFIEVCVYGKRHIALIVAGILTFSINFYLLIFISEVYVAVSQRHFGAFLFKFIGSGFIFVIVVFLLPASVKEEIFALTFERSLENSLSTIGDSGFVEGINTRVNSSGLFLYESFINQADFDELMVGREKAHINDTFVLSDYRILIVRYGFMGLLLTFILIIAYSRGNNRWYNLCLFFYAFLIIMHRAWYFQGVIIYLVMFLASCSKRCNADVSSVSMSII